MSDKLVYSGLKRLHEMGFKGQNVKIVTFEDTSKGHGKSVANVIKAAAPEATLLCRPLPGRQTKNGILTPESKEKLTAFYKSLLDEGVSIITYSVSGGYSQALADLEKEILGDRVTFFASAGNDGDTIKKSAPAYYDHWFAVGACNLIKGRPVRAGYSNVDQKLDFLAFTGIEGLSGTSGAAPLAACQWACLQSYALTQGRLFTPSEARELIPGWCEDLGDPGFDPQGGHGLFKIPETLPPVPKLELPDEQGGECLIVDVNLTFKNLEKRETTDTIVIHHAAASSCTVEDIHRWHIQNGWSGIGYHYFVRKNGLIYRGRPENTVGAHCAMHNLHTIGICCEGDFEKETMSTKQFVALVGLVSDLVKKYRASVKRHSDLVSTSCPGGNFPFGNLAISIVSKLNELFKGV